MTRVHCQRIRQGYTLIELVVSMGAATVLLGGLASSLFVTASVFEEFPATAETARAAQIQQDIARDLERATSFSSLTEENATFTIPDETGDGEEEILSYVHDKDLDELQITYNGTTATLLTGIKSSDFESIERDIAGSATAPEPYDENNWGMRWATVSAVFEEFSEEHQDLANSTIDVPMPSGTSEGDLLIFALAVDGDATSGMQVQEGGWNEIAIGTQGTVTLAVWWRIAEASEPDTYRGFFWGGAKMYGWIMRFTGHDPLNPINAISNLQTGGNTQAPPCPAVTTTVDNALVLRIGAFDDDDVDVDDTGLSGHTTITMDESGTSSSTSGGAGYVIQESAGDTGTANFDLQDSREEQYVTLTIAIAPE